ncbi:MAG: diaminopropionate ammonia-lyase [Gammaproteobacteria bacterium]|nr:diaminopropionate ammonia-lyase [Gammaproteobacteria bacterium]
MHNKLPEYWFELIMNPAVQQASTYPTELTQLFNTSSHNKAREIISSWPDYAPTPLRDLKGLAGLLGVSSIHYKDESERFGLGSFKPLGGAYAVARLLMRTIEAVSGSSDVQTRDIFNGRYASIVSDITVTSATDGNHGRSVAWGARRAGCKSVIYIHETVSTQREQAIARLGAEVRRVKGTYDDAVRAAKQTAREQGWHVIQDTTEGEDLETTLDIMQGYTLLASESIEQLPYRSAPTHVFVQAGVGGMAAAVLAHFWQRYGAERPRTILVEPDTAACCFLSIAAGQPTVAPGALDSIMAGLACGEVSSLAWQVLQPGAFAAIQVNDRDAADCMRLLADNRYGDGSLVAGESAVAGLAALIATAQDAEARRQLGLDEQSRVLLFGTEGATDPDAYEQIVGRKAEDVHA